GWDGRLNCPPRNYTSLAGEMKSAEVRPGQGDKKEKGWTGGSSPFDPYEQGVNAEEALPETNNASTQPSPRKYRKACSDAGLLLALLSFKLVVLSMLRRNRSAQMIAEESIDHVRGLSPASVNSSTLLR